MQTWTDIPGVRLILDMERRPRTPDPDSSISLALINLITVDNPNFPLPLLTVNFGVDRTLGMSRYAPLVVGDILLDGQDGVLDWVHLGLGRLELAD